MNLQVISTLFQIIGKHNFCCHFPSVLCIPTLMQMALRNILSDWYALGDLQAVQMSTSPIILKFQNKSVQFQTNNYSY
jgi:hypothetical protein